MGNVGWAQPLREAARYNAREAQKPDGADGYCPKCAYPLMTKKGKKVCNFCEWSGNL